MAQSFASCRFDFRIDSKNGLVPSFPRYSPLTRASNRSGKAFTCGICKAEFEMRSRLNDHKKTVHELRLDLKPIRIAPNLPRESDAARNASPAGGNTSNTSPASASTKEEDPTKNYNRCLLCGVDCGSADKILDHFVAAHQVVPTVKQPPKPTKPTPAPPVRLPARRGRRPGNRLGKAGKQAISVEHMLVSDQGFMVNATRRRGRPPKLKLKSLASCTNVAADVPPPLPSSLNTNPEPLPSNSPMPEIVPEPSVMNEPLVPMPATSEAMNQLMVTNMPAVSGTEGNPIQIGTIVNIPMFIQSAMPPQIPFTNLQHLASFRINPGEPVTLLDKIVLAPQVENSNGNAVSENSQIKLIDSPMLSLINEKLTVSSAPLQNISPLPEVQNGNNIIDCSQTDKCFNDDNPLTISSILNHSIDLTYGKTTENENSEEPLDMTKPAPVIAIPNDDDMSILEERDQCNELNLDEESVNIFSCDQCDFLSEEENEYRDHVDKFHSLTKKSKRMGFLKQMVDKLWERKKVVHITDSLEPDGKTTTTDVDTIDEDLITDEQKIPDNEQDDVCTNMREGEEMMDASDGTVDPLKFSIKPLNNNDATNLKKNMAAMTVTFHTCKVCKQLFDKPHKLWEHRVEHTYKKLCDDCEFQCVDKSEMAEHFAKYHSGLTSVQCSDCHHVAGTWLEAVGHIRTVHLNRHVYLCKDCGNVYLSKSRLQFHQQTNHSAEVPKVKCSYQRCGRVFNGTKSLRLHVAKIHGRYRRFMCPQRDCEKRFSSSYSLHNHMLIHTGKKSISCTYRGCDRTFSTMKHLRVHMLRHTDERPLKCTLCTYSCRQRNSMNWHMNSTHGYKKSKIVNFRRHRTVYVPTANSGEMKTSDDCSEMTESKVKIEQNNDDTMQPQSEPMDLSVSKTSQHAEKTHHQNFISDRDESSQHIVDNVSSEIQQHKGHEDISSVNEQPNTMTVEEEQHEKLTLQEQPNVLTLKEQPVHDSLPNGCGDSTFHHFRLVKKSNKNSTSHIDKSKAAFSKFVTCRYCHKLINSEEWVRKHQKETHDHNSASKSGKQYEYSCAKCTELQKVKHENKIEIDKTSGPKGVQLSIQSSGKEETNIGNSESMYDSGKKCKTGNKEYQLPANDIYLGTRNRTRQMNMKKDEEHAFPCDFIGCTKSFRMARHLHVHQLTHLECQTLNCNLCEYSCRQRNSLTWHMKSKHNCVVKKTRDKRIIYVQ